MRVIQSVGTPDIPVKRHSGNIRQIDQGAAA
jgi:hypothetical protein